MQRIAAQAAEPLVDLLVAAVDLLDIVDGASAFGGKGGDEERHARPDIRRADGRAIERRGAGDNGAVRIAQHDRRAHGDEFVNKKEPRFEHFLMDEAGTFRLGCDDEQNGEEVGWEAGPGAVFDAGNRSSEIFTDFQPLPRRTTMASPAAIRFPTPKRPNW